MYLSGLFIKAKYKRICFQGNIPYYILHPTQILKVSTNSRNKRNEKEKQDSKKIKTCNNVQSYFIQNTRLQLISI